MSALLEMDLKDRDDLLQAEKERYEEFCKRGLHLDMSRGNPSKDQLS